MASLSVNLPSMDAWLSPFRNAAGGFCLWEKITVLRGQVLVSRTVPLAIPGAVIAAPHLTCEPTLSVQFVALKSLKLCSLKGSRCSDPKKHNPCSKLLQAMLAIPRFGMELWQGLASAERKGFFRASFNALFGKH